jgi:adenosyl cobinamide kinase/adenosyl cobinamide phosphate guanylyltransferase
VEYIEQTTQRETQQRYIPTWATERERESEFRRDFENKGVQERVKEIKREREREWATFNFSTSSSEMLTNMERKSSRMSFRRSQFDVNAHVLREEKSVWASERERERGLSYTWPVSGVVESFK